MPIGQAPDWEMAEKLGLRVDFVPGDWRHGVDPAVVAERLAGDSAHEIKAVCAVHNETSTGVTSRIAEVRRAMDEAGHPALLLVDTISSLGSVDYRHDESVFARHDEARRAGVVLLPGSGFDVVPTDCLAALVAAELPAATELDLAFQASGGISGGTMKSALEGAAMGGRARVGGSLRTVPMGWRRREVPFPSGHRTVTSLPWGDVSTAFRSTGIGDITTFARLPGLDRVGPRASAFGRVVLGKPVAQRIGKAVIGSLVRGPGTAQRSKSWVEVYAEARDGQGRSASAALIGPDTYDFTADSVLRTVDGLLAGGVEAGAHTPSTAFGAEFVRRLHGIRVIGP